MLLSNYFKDSQNERQKVFFYILEPVEEGDASGQYWRNWWYQKRQDSGKIIKKLRFDRIELEVRER